MQDSPMHDSITQLGKAADTAGAAAQQAAEALEAIARPGKPTPMNARAARRANARLANRATKADRAEKLATARGTGLSAPETFNMIQSVKRINRETISRQNHPTARSTR